MFQKLRKDKEDIKKTQIELLEISTTIFEMKKKKTLDKINGRLDSMEGKISELEYSNRN